MPDQAHSTSTPAPSAANSTAPSASTGPSAAKPKRRVLRRVVWIAVIGLALAGGARWYAAHKTAAHDTSAKTADAPVPVDVATATRRDFPVFLNGLGVTQAWNTVTIRVRVDGQIEKIGFKEGQMVKQGDLLLHIDPRPFQAALDQAVAKKSLDETLLSNSRRDLERYNKVGTLAVSQQQIDTQGALVKQQEAQVKADQGAIDNAQVQLGYTTITAPISGRVGFRLVDKGNIVHAADPQGVAVITELQPIAVVFTAPEEELPRIISALRSGRLPVTAYTSDGKTELDKGTLALVDNQVDTTTGSIRLKGKFANPDLKLWPGLTVSTRLQIETLKNVVVVPDLAVQRGPDGLFVYVVGPDNTLALNKTVVGVMQGGMAVVTTGLEAGQRIVTSGAYRLQPGTPVEIRHSEDPDTVVGKRSAATPASMQVE